MTSPQDLRPQQRDDREDRKLGTQAPAAVSVHGGPETTPLDESFLDLSQTGQSGATSRLELQR